MLIGLTVVRNEGDIVGSVLRHAAAEHDLILVVDCCSTDDTADQIRAVSEELPHVVPIARLSEPTHAERVRRHMWACFSPHTPVHSWWSIVDGDEFAHESLLACVEQAEREGADHIEGAFATFAYTKGDAEAWKAGRETLADRERPIETRRRRYRWASYSNRLFRDHPELRWNDDTYSPTGLVRAMGRRAVFRHYQHRDLDQIELRLVTRQELTVSQSFSDVHYHWFYSPEDALVSDDDPQLREYVAGHPLDPGDALPRVWVRGPFRRALLRLARRRGARTLKQAPRLFNDVDVEEVLRRARAR